MSAHTPGPWVIFYADSDGPNDILPAGRPGCIARDIERIEDAHLIAAAPDMLAALLNVRKLIAEAAMTGFNWKDGDWTERLFASQATTSAAIAKAETKS